MADTEKNEVVVVVVGVGEEEEEEDKGEEEKILDFDMLCAAVALQAQNGFSCKENWDVEQGGEFNGGVQRMWEGEIMDCFEHRGIALETICCPCSRFGKNMKRAGLGSCFIQGFVYLIFSITAIVNYISYAVTKERGFLYLAVMITISSGAYLGFFRKLIRKQFNIGGDANTLDDCVNHLICPCCTLCQEARTLDINNVQEGIWRGRGDTTICIGSYKEGSKGFVESSMPHIQTRSPNLCSMQRASNGTDHSWTLDGSQSEALVP